MPAPLKICAIKFKARGDDNDVGLKKTFSANKQKPNMHRHESNCKYDITMFCDDDDDDMLAGILKHHKFIIHLPRRGKVIGKVEK